MINLRQLIDLLPTFYKERDSYKVNGKGILERFLEVCGTYLEDYVTKDIDNILDLIDLDKVPVMYLNYWWEYFGEIPFAYGNIIDPNKFNKYYNGLDPQKGVWILPKSGTIVLNESQVRSILKYAVALNKIRGTKLFFETLFRLYGFNITIEDKAQTKVDEDGNKLVYNGWILDHPLMDTEYQVLDEVYLDEKTSCTQCIPLNIDVSCIGTFLHPTNDSFKESLKILESHNRGSSWIENTTLYTPGIYRDPRTIEVFQGSIDNALWEIVKDQLEVPEGKVIYFSQDQDMYFDLNNVVIYLGLIPASLTEFLALRRMVAKVLDKYLPYNSHYHITYGGLEIYEDIVLTVSPYEPKDPDHPDTIFIYNDEREDIYLKYKVDVTTIWEESDTRFRMADESLVWSDPMDSGEIVDIFKAGTYYFKPESEYYHGEPYKLVIHKQRLDSTYKILYLTEPRSLSESSYYKDDMKTSLQFDPCREEFTFGICGIRTEETLNEGNDKVRNFYEEPIEYSSKYTGDSINPADTNIGVYKDPITRFNFNLYKAGQHNTLIMSGHQHLSYSPRVIRDDTNKVYIKSRPNNALSLDITSEKERAYGHLQYDATSDRLTFFVNTTYEDFASPSLLVKMIRADQANTVINTNLGQEIKDFFQSGDRLDMGTVVNWSKDEGGLYNYMVFRVVPITYVNRVNDVDIYQSSDFYEPRLRELEKELSVNNKHLVYGNIPENDGYPLLLMVYQDTQSNKIMYISSRVDAYDPKVDLSVSNNIPIVMQTLYGFRKESEPKGQMIYPTQKIKLIKRLSSGRERVMGGFYATEVTNPKGVEATDENSFSINGNIYMDEPGVYSLWDIAGDVTNFGALHPTNTPSKVSIRPGLYLHSAEFDDNQNRLSGNTLKPMVDNLREITTYEGSVANLYLKLYISINGKIMLLHNATVDVTLKVDNKVVRSFSLVTGKKITLDTSGEYTFTLRVNPIYHKTLNFTKI